MPFLKVPMSYRSRNTAEGSSFHIRVERRKKVLENRTVEDQNGLSQLVKTDTRLPDVDSHMPSLLDLLLTTHPRKYQVTVEAPLRSSHHCLVRSVVPIQRSARTTPAIRRVWHYKSANWDGMRSFLASYPWGPICFLSDDPSDAAAAVADVILQGMELFVPCSVVPLGGRSRPWFDASVRAAAASKRRTYQAWANALVAKDPNSRVLKRKYNRASRFFKRQIARAKKTIRQSLFSLDVHKSSGPDGISPLVLRTCAPELTPVLMRLFRHSYLSSGPYLRSVPLSIQSLKKVLARTQLTTYLSPLPLFSPN